MFLQLLRLWRWFCCAQRDGVACSSQVSFLNVGAMFLLFQRAVTSPDCHSFSSRMNSVLASSSARSCRCISAGPTDLCTFRFLNLIFSYNGWFFCILKRIFKNPWFPYSLLFTSRSIFVMNICLLNRMPKSSNFSLFDQILRTMFCLKLVLCDVLDDAVGD